MVIHYQPERLRHNSDQPTAITDVLVATSGSSYDTGDIPLGTPTCSARSRQGRWALYPNGEEVVVVWPGGALVGPAVEVARELDRLGDDRDDLDSAAVRAIRLPDRPRCPGQQCGRRLGRGPGPARPSATGSAAPPTSLAPATRRQPAGPAHPHLCHIHRFHCPTPAPSQHHNGPPDRTTQPTPTHWTRHVDRWRNSLSTLYRLTNDRIGGRSIAGSPILLLAPGGGSASSGPDRSPSRWSDGPSRWEPQCLSDNPVRNVSVARVMAPRAASVSARVLSMTKSWMMAWKRSAVTGTPAWRSLSA